MAEHDLAQKTYDRCRLYEKIAFHTHRELIMLTDLYCLLLIKMSDLRDGSLELVISIPLAGLSLSSGINVSTIW